MKIYDLPVMQGRVKSFYGKAKVIEEDNGEKVLQSYNTKVCKITSSGKAFEGIPGKFLWPVCGSVGKA